MSIIREGIAQLKTRPSHSPPSRPPRGRGGVLDLVVVVGLMVAMISRTPLGGLVSYAALRVTGGAAAVPSLTAYFSNGLIGADLSGVEVVMPDDTPPEDRANDILPEPWRTAARTSLARGIPAALKATLPEPSPAAALTSLDALWVEYGDAQVVMEIAALGPEQRARAVHRAVAAGDTDPAHYAGYRRYLPGPVARRADRFVGSTVALAKALDLDWPIATDSTLVSTFGERIHPVLKRKHLHNGIDLAVPEGTPVVAAQAGEVAVVGESEASGRYLVIDHGYGVRTAYLHLQSADVELATIVERGQVVAKSGNTGRSTGPHLHFTLRIGGTAVDPLRFRPKP